MEFYPFLDTFRLFTEMRKNNQTNKVASCWYLFWMWHPFFSFSVKKCWKIKKKQTKKLQKMHKSRVHVFTQCACTLYMGTCTGLDNFRLVGRPNVIYAEDLVKIWVHLEKKRDTRTDKQMYKQMDEQTDKQKDRLTDKQMDNQTDKQTDKGTDNCQIYIRIWWYISFV